MAGAPLPERATAGLRRPDSSPGYRKALTGNLPNVELVSDWFRVIKLAGEAVDRMRRREVRQAAQTTKRKAHGFRTLRCLRTVTYPVANHLDLQPPDALPA